MEIKGNAVKFSILWEAEKKALKNVDWATTSLHDLYLESKNMKQSLSQLIIGNAKK
jgi:hypothetical protein